MNFRKNFAPFKLKHFSSKFQLRSFLFVKAEYRTTLNTKFYQIFIPFNPFPVDALLTSQRIAGRALNKTTKSLIFILQLRSPKLTLFIFTTTYENNPLKILPFVNW